MSSINPQIDAAVPLMKARAAEFDDEKTMDGMTPARCAVLAYQNIKKVVLGDAAKPLDRNGIIDCMNLCALALSLLPRQPGCDGCAESDATGMCFADSCDVHPEESC